MLARVLLLQIAFSGLALRVQIRDKVNETALTALEEKQEWPEWDTFPNRDNCGLMQGVGGMGGANNFCFGMPFPYLNECCKLCSAEIDPTRYKSTFYGVDECFIFQDWNPAKIDFFNTAACVPFSDSEPLTILEFNGPVKDLSQGVQGAERHWYTSHRLAAGMFMENNKCYEATWAKTHHLDEYATGAFNAGFYSSSYYKCACASAGARPTCNVWDKAGCDVAFGAGNPVTGTPAAYLATPMQGMTGFTTEAMCITYGATTVAAPVLLGLTGAAGTATAGLAFLSQKKNFGIQYGQGASCPR